MKGKGIFAVVALVFCAIVVNAWAESPAKMVKTQTPSDHILPDITAIQWTGDLDGMIKRRIIRVLVPYSKTNYFVDRGTQRGLTYEVFRLFEDFLNKKLKKKSRPNHFLMNKKERIRKGAFYFLRYLFSI